MRLKLLTCIKRSLDALEAPLTLFMALVIRYAEPELLDLTVTPIHLLSVN